MEACVCCESTRRESSQPVSEEIQGALLCFYCCCWGRLCLFCIECSPPAGSCSVLSAQNQTPHAPWYPIHDLSIIISWIESTEDMWCSVMYHHKSGNTIIYIGMWNISQVARSKDKGRWKLSIVFWKRLICHYCVPFEMVLLRKASRSYIKRNWQEVIALFPWKPDSLLGIPFTFSFWDCFL